jgi:hypothetical protein
MHPAIVTGKVSYSPARRVLLGRDGAWSRRRKWSGAMNTAGSQRCHDRTGRKVARSWGAEGHG